MRVLHISETMVSGVLKYIREVVRIEDRKGNEQFILYSMRNYTPIDLQELFSDRVHLVNVDIKFGLGFFKTFRTLYKHILQINPDVIHLHSSIAGFFGRLVTLCFPKIKVFYTPHGYSFLMTNKLKLTRAMYCLTEFVLSQLNSNIIACSKSEYRYAKRLSPFRFVYLLENCTKAIQIPKNSELIISNKQIVGVGRLEEQKNPKLFIEIAAELRQFDPTIKAVWIGDGSLRSECEKLNHLLDANVIFTGWLSNDETMNYLRQSDVFLQTSKWEGLPYSVLEAFAVGLPVVASDINSHRDIIGKNYLGFIAKYKKEFINYTVMLLNDNGLANKISETNKMKLEENYALFSQNVHFIYSGHLL